MNDRNSFRRIDGRFRLVLLAALASGTLGFGSAALGEGGGDPPGSAPVDWAAQRQAERSGLTTGDTRSAQRAAGAAGAAGASRGHVDNSAQARRNYNNRGNRYVDRGNNRYDQRYRSYSYHGPSRSYSYREPYGYAPPPLAYDPYPSPGISLFFNF